MTIQEKTTLDMTPTVAIDQQSTVWVEEIGIVRTNNRSYSDRRSSYRRENTDYSGHDYRQERSRDGRRWRD